jgi:hypothetical protein
MTTTVIALAVLIVLALGGYAEYRREKDQEERERQE